MVWVGSLARSYVDRAASDVGHAAMLADQAKEHKYSALQDAYCFRSLPFETFREAHTPWGYKHGFC